MHNNAIGNEVMGKRFSEVVNVFGAEMGERGDGVSKGITVGGDAPIQLRQLGRLGGVGDKANLTVKEDA